MADTVTEVQGTDAQPEIRKQNRWGFLGKFKNRLSGNFRKSTEVLTNSNEQDQEVPAGSGLELMLKEMEKPQKDAADSLRKLYKNYIEMIKNYRNLDERSRANVLQLLRDGNPTMIYKISQEYMNYLHRQNSSLQDGKTIEEHLRKINEQGSANGVILAALPMVFKITAEDTRKIKNTPLGNLAGQIKDEITLAAEFPESVEKQKPPVVGQTLEQVAAELNKSIRTLDREPQPTR